MKGKSRRLVLVGSAALGALAILFAGMVFYRLSNPTTPLILGADGRPLPGSVARLEELSLGGVRQTILIRGTSRNLPLLLLLHGGPGSPDMAVVRRYLGALEKEFLVVSWDQRGSGKSYDPKRIDELDFSRLEGDLDELVDVLRTRYGKDKILLLGHSWGTILGSTYAKLHPEKLLAYIGVGQVVDWAEQERLSYGVALDWAVSAGDAKALAALRKIGAPIDGEYRGGMDSLIMQRQLLIRSGRVIRGSRDYSLVAAAYQNTPETSLKDFLSLGPAMRQSLARLWGKVRGWRLAEEVPELKVPAYFITGSRDGITALSLLEPWFEKLRADHKRLIVLEGEAHYPQVTSPDLFVATLAGIKKELLL